MPFSRVAEGSLLNGWVFRKLGEAVEKKANRQAANGHHCDVLGQLDYSVPVAALSSYDPRQLDPALSQAVLDPVALDRIRAGKHLAATTLREPLDAEPLECLLAAVQCNKPVASRCGEPALGVGQVLQQNRVRTVKPTVSSRHDAATVEAIEFRIRRGRRASPSSG